MAAIDADTLPLDTEDFADLSFDLPRLSPDTAESCPISWSRIQDYVRNESGDLDASDFSRMTFVRTAQINEGRAWIWRLIESNDEEAFVIVADRGQGRPLGLGLVSNWELNLSAEQYLVAYYFERVY